MSELWNEDEITKLVSLWNDGKSASEISRKMRGRTRNAVITKIDRLSKDDDKRLKRPLNRDSFSDAMLLDLMYMRETLGKSFPEIALHLRRSEFAVRTRYDNIIRDMKRAGWS